MTPSEVADKLGERAKDEMTDGRIEVLGAVTILTLIAENEAKDAEIERLREALKPFSEASATLSSRTRPR